MSDTNQETYQAQEKHSAQENLLRLKVHDFLSLTVIEMMIEKGLLSSEEVIERLDSKAGGISYKDGLTPREILVIQAEFALIRERLVGAEK